VRGEGIAYPIARQFAKPRPDLRVIVGCFLQQKSLLLSQQRKPYFGPKRGATTASGVGISPRNRDIQRSELIFKNWILFLMNLRARRLDDRIRELCTDAVAAEDYPKAKSILSELQSAVHQYTQRLRARARCNFHRPRFPSRTAPEFRRPPKKLRSLVRLTPTRRLGPRNTFDEKAAFDPCPSPIPPLAPEVHGLSDR